MGKPDLKARIRVIKEHTRVVLSELSDKILRFNGLLIRIMNNFLILLYGLFKSDKLCN